MKIGIDGIVLRGRDAGSLRYFEQLLTGLAEMDSANDHIVFANATIFSPDIPTRHNLLWEDVRTPSLVPGAIRQQLFGGWHSRGKLDLLHCPAFVPPLAYSGRTVTTIFDLTFERYPQTMKRTGRMWWKLLGRKGIQKSGRLITLSENTKRDLETHYRIPKEKIHVVYPCTRDIFRPHPYPRVIADKYNLPDRYVLYVGTLERRKNISNLIRAFALAKRMGKLDHRLVLCGKRGWLYQDIFATVQELGLTESVLELGFVADGDLPGLYSAADAFVYLSRYEGFGLPVLEAMSCGTPVLASNAASLPEVVGDAGIMVSPDDVENAAAQLARILLDQELRQFLITRGLARAQLFTCERFIRGIITVYNLAVQS